MKGFLGFFKTSSKKSSAANETRLKGRRAFERGKVHLIARCDQEALDCFDEAIGCGFENALVFGLRGSCLQSLQWELDAIDDFTKAISLEPEDCNLYFQRAMARISIGDKAGFEADLRDAVHLASVESPANLNYNEGARQMGWPNAAAMYGAQSVQAQTPDFITIKSRERSQLRGKRPVT